MSLLASLNEQPELNRNALVMFCAMAKALKQLRSEITITEPELRAFQLEIKREGGPIRILQGTNMATMDRLYRVRLRRGNESLDMTGNLMPRKNRIITLD